ncbi:AAA family ATPase [Sphingomonas sp.]|uniref:AAA family ATPase n=1 Tax=Sphingomonas sp. TaxID=28214 RepID=UPI0025FCF745|nr:AAA family ATPase [Sphingomonas sp.]
MTSVQSHILPLVEGMPLYPAQRSALEQLEEMKTRFNVFAFIGSRGFGVSRTLTEFATRHGATLLDAGDYFSRFQKTAEDRWDERVKQFIDEAFDRSDILILDDFPFLEHQVAQRVDREGFIASAIPGWRRRATEEGKTLILAGGYGSNRGESEFEIQWSLENTYILDPGQIVTLNQDCLGLGDFRAIIENHAGAELCAGVDFETLFFSFPGLAPRQLALAGSLAKLAGASDTAAFADIIGNSVTRSNVRLSEVENLAFEDLPGSEHIAETLETHVVLPFERPEVARRLGIKARRGVMLFGPAGTGKTTMGRALAHRMKGKFFVIDGTVATEPGHAFAARVNAIIDQAKKNAPSVLFIDDADTLFTIPHAVGMVRSLLSLLDGVESDTAGKVCVMMTVMDARKVPDAILRSGRVELWLETEFPQAPLRARILARWIEARGEGAFPPGAIDYDEFAGLTERFNPADLRRVVGDAALLYAADLAAGTQTGSASDYLRSAIDELIKVRRRMSDVLQDPSLLAGKKIEEYL